MKFGFVLVWNEVVVIVKTLFLDCWDKKLGGWGILVRDKMVSDVSVLCHYWRKTDSVPGRRILSMEHVLGYPNKVAAEVQH